MTQEQIQSALDFLKNARQDKIDIDDNLVRIWSAVVRIWSSGCPQKFVYEYADLVEHILTQALEIAKGDHVVVPREATEEMLNILKDSAETEGYFDDEHYKSLYKAMIAVAEGDK